jgi:hypothetical protein
MPAYMKSGVMRRADNTISRAPYLIIHELPAGVFLQHREEIDDVGVLFHD